jgi:putative endonuclease
VSTTKGSAPSTRSADEPVRLVWSVQLNRMDEAFWIEKQIQGWARAKRQALIDGRYEELPALARTAKAPEE